MARMYTNYLNNGREGCTWAALVATTLTCSNYVWMTCRQIAESIKPDPPPSLISQVNAALDKLIGTKLVTYRRNQGQPDGSRWEYSATSACNAQFEPAGPWVAAEHTDSELFVPNRKPRKARRNNVVRFRPVKRAG